MALERNNEEASSINRIFEIAKMNSKAVLIFGRLLVIIAVLCDMTIARPISDKTPDKSIRRQLQVTDSKIINESDKEDYDSHLANFLDYYPDYNTDLNGDYNYPGDDDDLLKTATNKKPDRFVPSDREENDGYPTDETPKNEMGTFLPIPMPTDFDSYDVNVTDGFISLAELVAVTGAKENVELAFKASDIDGDGRLTLEEFKEAPLMLQGETPYDIETLVNVERELFTDETAIGDLVRKLGIDDSGNHEMVERLKNTLAEVRQNEDDVESVIGKTLFTDDFETNGH
ncbi:unnamed protein product [Owenia fusiformis]|uniref:EF-hand domain-containing protein n=1 Tax=Owenia fusiformis TaxID=6347 RepID=A0A8S4PFX0_OWEFU|nr:unnamed protein product [Owenia fusiformis]